MRIFILMFLAAVAFVSSGCSKSEPAVIVSSIPVNTVCPIMGGEVQSDGGSAIWNGTTVAFCCEGCAPKWDKLSDEDKAAKLPAANKPEQGPGQQDHDNSGDDHSPPEQES